MSSLAPVDILEEDAADLQFPKDDDILEINPNIHTHRTVKHYRPSVVTDTDTTSNLTCLTCSIVLAEPYIKCADCIDEFFCLKCFACGRETQQHRNNHSYVIRHDNICVFPGCNWSAKEEKQFLDLIRLHGYGNWDDIAKLMNTKSAIECCEHYHQYYFGGIFEKIIGLCREPYFPERIPYVYKMKSLEPPRPTLDSATFKLMAGYHSGRSEFDTPFDNSAETMVSNLNLYEWPIDQEIGDTLNCAMFMAYSHRLEERQRRNRIMRDHGLITVNRTLGWISKYAEALGSSDQSMRAGQSFNGGRFIAFMQLISGPAFDLLVESMQYAHDVRKYIFRLYELRKNGIVTFRGGKLFHKLRAQRMSKIRDKRAELYESACDWKQLVPNAANNTVASVVQLPNQLLLNMNTPIRRKSVPLDILGLPSYEKLTEDEKQLCSRVRLIPSAYLGYKTMLMGENAKIGYLRLADARRLIKIDVNKTRQLYDFLLKSGYVNKPFS